jgi:mono/diheme cytochrome c family protein
LIWIISRGPALPQISISLAAIAALVSAAAVHADDGDAFRGQAFAQQLCSGCHRIEKDQTSSPISAVPPFASLVARVESWNGESLADWLGTRHPVINGVAVKPTVALDLLVYVRFLGPSKQQAALDR